VKDFTGAAARTALEKHIADGFDRAGFHRARIV
jgi:hypothetical protein